MAEALLRRGFGANGLEGVVGTPSPSVISLTVSTGSSASDGVDDVSGPHAVWANSSLDGNHVDGDDPVGPGDTGPLNGREADTPAADDDHRGAGFDLGRAEYGTQPGGDAAQPISAALSNGMSLRDLDQRMCSCTNICSANEDRCKEVVEMSSPSLVRREGSVPSDRHPVPARSFLLRQVDRIIRPVHRSTVAAERRRGR